MMKKIIKLIIYFILTKMFLVIVGKQKHNMVMAVSHINAKKSLRKLKKAKKRYESSQVK